MSESEKTNIQNKSANLPRPQKSCLFFALIATVVACITLVFIWLKTLETVETIAEGLLLPFHESNIQETFQSTAFTARGNEGGILEVATATTNETFKRSSEYSLFDHTLPLGTTISEIQLPATYRYHIDLNAPWEIRSQGNKCIVVAPKIAPTLPVAFDTGEMKTKTASGWGRWDKHKNLKTLERSLTGKLAKNAVLAENIDKVRDEARRSIAKFIQAWLLKHQHWDENRFSEIIVIFPDEVNKNLPLPPATLQLQQATITPSPKPAH